MKRKGFTLVELLAVIVILSVILIIAIPIVQNTIQDAIDSSKRASVELYARAVNQAISVYQMENHSDPEEFEDLEDYIEYSGDPVSCKVHEINDSITIFLAGCKVGTPGEEVEVDIAIGNPTAKASIQLYGIAADKAIQKYKVKQGKNPVNFKDIEKYIEYSGSTVSCAIQEIRDDMTSFLGGCKVNNTEVEEYMYNNPSKKASIQLYGMAADKAIKSYKQKTSSNPTKFSDIEGYIEYIGSTVSCNTKKINSDNPNDIKVYLKECSVEGDAVSGYTYGVKPFVCNLVSGSSKNEGSKYTCDLDTYRTFYVLDTSVSGKVTLILDRNYTDEVVPSGMTWCNQFGPNPENNICNHDGLDSYIQHIQNKWQNDELVVKLPSALQLQKHRVAELSSFPVWLYDYLDSAPHNVSGVYGYWTGEVENGTIYAKRVYNETGSKAFINGSKVSSTAGRGCNGIRPTITINTTSLN